MENILNFLKNRKRLTSAVVLGILIIGILVGLNLVKLQQIFKSRAAGEPIEFVKSTNVDVKPNTDSWVTTNSQIQFKVTSPLNPPPPGGASPTPNSTQPPSGCPNKFIFGLNGSVTPEIKALYTNPSIRFMAVGWGGIQPTVTSGYNFTSMDAEVNQALADGQTPAVKFCDGDCFPDWARQMDTPVDSTYCCSSEHVCRVLKDDQGTEEAFKNVVIAMVNRYKDRITQWDYGIEPNCRGYNPQRYTKWLKAFNEAVRSADSGATVIGGHLSGANREYLTAMYDAGAGPYFDRLAVDPYGPDGQALEYAKLEDIRNIMVSQGDSNKKIWFGEWGVASKFDEANQARLIEEGLNYMESKPWIEAAFYHNFECELWTSSCTPGSPGYLGFSLQRSDGTTKPAYDVFKAKAGACGN